MRERATGGVLICWLIAGFSASGQEPAPRPTASARALQFLSSLDPDIDAAVRALRPAAAPTDMRRRALASLPNDGALHAERDELLKLSRVEPLLAYHERSSVFETRLIDVPQAFVGLHWRSVLLISRPALSVLSATELQALVAHEIGHDYFWEPYLSARSHGDTVALQEIELKCDVIAVLTLAALGLDPAALGRAARKMARFNVRVAIANADEYPTPAERNEFLRVLVSTRGASVRRRPTS
jgi:hypothetical protein